MANLTNNNKLCNADEQIKSKGRRKKSLVWEHFTIETIDAESTRACCKQCKKSFAYISGSRPAGTSHLKRHISLGICPVSRVNHGSSQATSCTLVSNINGTQGVDDLPRKRYRGTSGSASFSFDQDYCRHEIAKMIIMHDYPLDMGEHPGFVDSVRALQPQFKVVALDAIQKDCVGLYQREKHALLNLICSIPGRVSLSLDMWSTDRSICYACITGQFIDNDWRLHRKILAVVLLPFPDSESAFNHAVVSCITEWNLDSKLFTVTLDESFSNEAVQRNLRGLLSINNPLVLNGQLVIGSCYARVLSRLALDALTSMKETVKKVRDSVKYVVTVESHQVRFNDLKQQLQVPSTKSLNLDNQTQWNTTYQMLAASSELQEVFSCFDAFDPNYRETPSMDEWKEVEILCTFLKLLFDAANLLVGPTYPTTNAFFHKVWKIQLELTHAAMSEDAFISNLTKPMHERFDKYWKDCSLVFAIAVVMDPRFKMKLVEFSFSRIYMDDAPNMMKEVHDGVHELFLDYVVQMLPPPTFVVNWNGGSTRTDVSQDDILLSTSDGLSDFDIYISESSSHLNMKSELDQYLEESLLPRMQEFDVLGWWKLNRQKYPTLAKMAADILCIPVSTVSRESVFDITCKKMDRHRTSLDPSTLEALVCAKDWLQQGSSECSPSDSSDSMVKMES